MSYYGTYIKNIFHVKIQLFVTETSDHDLDPDPHRLAPWIRIRIWIRIEVKSWIWIRIETNADPEHY